MPKQSFKTLLWPHSHLIEMVFQALPTKQLLDFSSFPDISGLLLISFSYLCLGPCRSSGSCSFISRLFRVREIGNQRIEIGGFNFLRCSSHFSSRTTEANLERFQSCWPNFFLDLLDVAAHSVSKTMSILIAHSKRNASRDYGLHIRVADPHEAWLHPYHFQ